MLRNLLSQVRSVERNYNKELYDVERRTYALDREKTDAAV